MSLRSMLIGEANPNASIFVFLSLDFGVNLKHFLVHLLVHSPDQSGLLKFSVVAITHSSVR